MVQTRVDGKSKMRKSQPWPVAIRKDLEVVTRSIVYGHAGAMGEYGCDSGKAGHKREHGALTAWLKSSSSCGDGERVREEGKSEPAPTKRLTRTLAT